MMTEKLYESNGMLFRFQARILSVTPAESSYAVILDRTAFFPEGGGQSADPGMIGDAHVLDVQIQGDEILHFTDKIPSGSMADCTLDAEVRLRKMQNHLGEHLLCGAIHHLYGYDNVGFHLGIDYMTFDIDGVLTAEQIREAELLANRAVAEDAPVRCYIPEKEMLAALSYRAKSEKLEAADAIRIVEVEGFDRCACCAPHLDRAGKIGAIKIVEAMHYKGGMRFHAFCGFDAIADYDKRLRQVHEISTLLSAKPDEIVPAVLKKLEEMTAQRHELGALRRAHAAALLRAIPNSDQNLCIFDSILDANTMREFANGAISKANGLVAVFVGDEEHGYQFVIASEKIPLRAQSEKIRNALGGKCGGSDRMLFGFSPKKEEEIRAFFA